MKKMLTAAGAVVLAAILAACDGSGAGSEQAATTTVPPAAPSVTASVDWEARTVEVDGLEGYEIEFCEGEAPFLCVSEDGEWIGGIELASFPGDELLAGGAQAWLDDFLSTIADDRRRGCDPGFEVTGDDLEPAPFAGADGFRYGFTGTIGGRVVERVVGHAVVVGGDSHLLVLNGLADDGCLAREGELPVDAVDDLVPALAALAEGSTNLPSPEAGEPAPPASGEASGWLRGRSDEGFVDIDAAVMLGGEEAVAAATEDGAMQPGETTLPNDFYIDDDEASVRTYPVSDELVVELYDCTAGCELRQVPAADFLAHRVQPFGGEHALVDLDVHDGVVVHLREIYVP